MNVVINHIYPCDFKIDGLKGFFLAIPLFYSRVFLERNLVRLLMADFRNDNTMTTPSWELIKILALQKREDLMLAIEFYMKHKYEDQHEDNDVELNFVRARLWVLYYELEAWLNRAYDNEVILLYTGKIDSKKKEEVFEVVTWINKFMDEQKLTRIDNIKKQDNTRVMQDNESDEY